MQPLHLATASYLQDNSYNLSLMLIITIMKTDTHGENILHLLILEDTKEEIQES